MNKSFQLIFWGVFLSTFNITVGDIQILPAFVAFLILRSGLKQVLKVMPCAEFQRALVLCNFNVGFGAVAFVLNFFSGGSLLFILSVLLLSVSFTLQLGLFFYLLSGSAVYFSTHAEVSLPPKPAYRWPERDSEETRAMPESLSTGKGLAVRYARKANIFTVCLTIDTIWIFWNLIFENSTQVLPTVIYIILKIWLLVQLGNIRAQATDLEDPLQINALQKPSVSTTASPKDAKMTSAAAPEDTKMTSAEDGEMTSVAPRRYGSHGSDMDPQ